MLTHPTLDQLHGLGLAGMAKAFADLTTNDEAAGLGHADWLALLLDREAVYRQDRRLGARLRHATLAPPRRRPRISIIAPAGGSTGRFEEAHRGRLDRGP